MADAAIGAQMPPCKFAKLSKRDPLFPGVLAGIHGGRVLKLRPELHAASNEPRAAILRSVTILLIGNPDRARYAAPRSRTITDRPSRVISSFPSRASQPTAMNRI